MSKIVLERVELTTDSSGDVSADTPREINGKLIQIAYDKPAADDFDNNWSLTITGKKTGITYYSESSLGTSDFLRAPRQVTHLNSDGSALLYADSGESVADLMAVCEQLTLTVASGGDEQTGVIWLFIEVE